MRDTGIELRRFLYEAENGSYDLPPMQRTLSVHPAFAVKLIDSLYRGYRVGSLLIWEPPVGQRPASGRYQASQGRPRWWILDGQQRSTAYVGAFGRRPHWIPADRWQTVGGPGLEVAVRFTTTGRTQFRPYLPGRPRYIRLADLVTDTDADIRSLLEGAGIPATDARVEQALQLKTGLQQYVLPVEWLASDWGDAAENFIRRNPTLRSEERALCSLSIAYEDLQRDHIDQLVERGSTAGFPVALDRRQLNQVLQGFLPRKARHGQGRWAEQNAVRAAAERTEAAVGQVIPFLHRQGITHDSLLWSPPVIRVLAALFDRFPQAAGSAFTWRWLAHAAAGQHHSGGPHWSRNIHESQRILAAESFTEAQQIIAQHEAGGTVPRLRAQDLIGAPGTRARLGAAGTLYAMACAHQTRGPVVDLADPSVVFPDPRMRPHPLWQEAESGAAACALVTERSARAIKAGGGWGREAFERLDVPPGVLAAHQLSAPAGGGPVWSVEGQAKERADAVAETINTFLDRLEPLSPAS